MDNITRREREKQVREGEIIAAAEKIFCKNGFDDASMDEIAAEAQFTKRTLYQYFANKEDLYFAVALKGFKMLFNYLQEASVNEQTGYMKIYYSCVGYYKFYKDFPEILRLMDYIGHVKKKSKEDGERRKELVQFNNEIFKWVAKWIEEGKDDGSICNDLDAAKTSFSIVFMMTGFFSQMAANGETFMEHFTLEPENFIFSSMDLLFRSIKDNK